MSCTSAQLAEIRVALVVQGGCSTRGRAGGHEASQEPPGAGEGGLGAPGDCCPMTVSPNADQAPGWCQHGVALSWQRERRWCRHSSSMLSSVCVALAPQPLPVVICLLAPSLLALCWLMMMTLPATCNVLRAMRLGRLAVASKWQSPCACRQPAKGLQEQ